MAYSSAPSARGAVGGPPIGGFVVELFGWRGIFLLTAVLTVAAIAFAQIVLDRRRTDGALSGGRFDLGGAITSTAVLVVFLLAMSNGAEFGWRSAPIVAGFAAVIGLAGLLHLLGAAGPQPDARRDPVPAPGLHRRRGVASAISFMSISSVRFLMPFYLQSVLGYSPGAVGLVLVPAAFAMILMGPLGGRLSDRYGWTPFNVGGTGPLRGRAVRSLEGNGGIANRADSPGDRDPERGVRHLQSHPITARS